MTGTLVRTALRRSLRDIRYLTPTDPKDARGVVARVYAEAERDFGLVAAPLALHSPVPEMLAASWQLLRETLLVQGLLSRADKEAVAAAVSRANQCPYCVDVHSATLRGLQRKGTPANDRIAGITAWASTASRRSLGGDGAFPFAAELAPELCGVLMTFEYLNRMVEIFLPGSPLPPQVPARAQPAALAMLGSIMSSHARTPVPAGLPSDGELPENFTWAKGNPPIAAALSNAGTVFGGSLPQPLTGAGAVDLVVTELFAWDGSAPGPSRAWAHELVAKLAEPERAAVVLALLTIKAPYQVDDTIVAEFQRHHPGDAALLTLTGWASAVTAARIAGGLVTSTD